MVRETVDLCNYLLSRFAGKIVSGAAASLLPYVKHEHRHTLPPEEERARDADHGVVVESVTKRASMGVVIVDTAHLIVCASRATDSPERGCFFDQLWRFISMQFWVCGTHQQRN